MRKFTLAVFGVPLVLSLTGIAQAGVALPHRYAPSSLDRGLVQIQNVVSGNGWSVWSYRSGAEYDIAVSENLPDGSWSEPDFLGQRDGLSQIQPALAADAAGNLYLAFAIRETGQVMLSTLRAGSTAWSAPSVVPLGAGRAMSPALRVVGEHVVLGYRIGTSVRMTLLPRLGSVSGHGSQDGPDGFPPGSSNSDDGLHSEQ